MKATELRDIKNQVQLIDVREDSEFAAGHISGSRHVPLGRLSEELASIGGEPVVTVCRTGPRSDRAAATLRDHGFSAESLDGGVTAWVAAGQSLVDAGGNPGTVQDPTEEEPLPPELASIHSNLVEIAMALQDRFGDRQPTDEQAKSFMREWLENKGTAAEEIDRILEE